MPARKSEHIPFNRIHESKSQSPDLNMQAELGCFEGNCGRLKIGSIRWARLNIHGPQYNLPIAKEPARLNLGGPHLSRARKLLGSQTSQIILAEHMGHRGKTPGSLIS